MSPSLALFGPDGSNWRCPFKSKADAGTGHQYAKESKARLIDPQRVARKPMQKPPLDPDVADTAPSDPVLTVYDEEHIITYLRLLTRMRKVLTGAKSHEWCCILIPNMKPIAPGGRSRATYRAPNG